MKTVRITLFYLLLTFLSAHGKMTELGNGYEIDESYIQEIEIVDNHHDFVVLRLKHDGFEFGLYIGYHPYFDTEARVEIVTRYSYPILQILPIDKEEESADLVLFRGGGKSRDSAIFHAWIKSNDLSKIKKLSYFLTCIEFNPSPPDTQSPLTPTPPSE